MIFSFLFFIFSPGNVMASKKEDCVICHKEFVDRADKVEVGKKGLATLIEFSQKRDDSDFYDYLTSIANSENCYTNIVGRTMQTNDVVLIIQIREKINHRLKGYSHMLHDFIGKQNVFFCAETADELHLEIPTRTASVLPF